MENKIIIFALFIVVFSILFSALASADLYLNSKTGTIYFNTTVIARASIGPQGNFTINTSDFFVNQKNLEFGFLDDRSVLIDTLRHTNLGRVGIGTATFTDK